MSVQFNNLLGRSEFSDEGLLDVFVWGLRSCLGPAAVLLQNIVILALLAVLRRLAVSLFPAAAAFETRTLERIKARAKSLGVDDAQVLASLLLLLSMASLVGAWWYFTPIYDTLSAHISTEPAGRLAVLSPDFFDYRSLYRKTFIGVSNFTVLAWYVVNRVWTPKRSPLDWAVTLGAGAIVLLSLTSLELPYRTFLHNDFETAQWHGQSCYALGERGDEMLISCPALPPPPDVKTDLEVLVELAERLGRGSYFSSEPREVSTSLTAHGIVRGVDLATRARRPEGAVADLT